MGSAWTIAQPATRLSVPAAQQWWIANPPILQSFSITESWGSQPATGTATYVYPYGTPPSIIPVGCGVRITTTEGHIFPGLCKSDNPVTSAGGNHRVLEFVDLRDLLDWDIVYGAFNMPEKIWYNGRRVRRYWNILPDSRDGTRVDFSCWQKTYRATPFTVKEILAYLLTSKYVESDWLITTHLYQSSITTVGSYRCPTYPVIGLDWTGGIPLSQALTELGNKHGLTFTLAATSTRDYNLVYQQIGNGGIPKWDSTGVSAAASNTLNFPPNSDEQRLGESLSGNPTRIKVVGDRNLYQCCYLEMQQDWATAWANYFDISVLVEWVYNNLSDPYTGTAYKSISGDTEHLEGWALAAARARVITVREMVTYLGSSYADYHYYSGQCRMDIPAAVYIQQILFRAFRPPSTLVIMGVGRANTSIELQSESLVNMTHNAVTGVIFKSTDQATDGGNGYAIARGYLIGQDAFNTIQPEQLTAAFWNNLQLTWQHVTFHIDNSAYDGGYILFDEPVIRTDNLIHEATAAVGNDAKTIGVFNAAATFQTVPVRASLTFACEKFIYPPEGLYRGGQYRDASEVVPGLYREVVAYSDGSWEEIPYEDGTYAANKAQIIAAAKLQNYAFSWYNGGFVRKLRPGDQALRLYQWPALSQITYRWGPDGYTEAVDFTNQRQTDAYRPPIDFDRQRLSQGLVPGQAELRQEARNLQKQAAAFRLNKDFVGYISRIFHGAPGELPDSNYGTTRIDGSGTLNVGTPLWSNPSTQVCSVAPASTTSSTTKFMGVTVRHNESLGRPISVKRSGTAFIRVKGPVEVGDSLGFSEGNDYLEVDGTPMVGTSKADHTGTDVRLVQVLIGGGGGGGTGGDLPVWL